MTSIVDTPPRGALAVGNTVKLTLKLNEVVTVSGGTPTLTLNDGGVATYLSGSGTNALTFTYTVGASNMNVAALAASSINLNGATIVDKAEVSAGLSLSGVSQSGPQIFATPSLSGALPLSGVSFSGSKRSVYVKSGITEAITGSSDTIQATGTGNNLSVVGASDTVYANAGGNTITIGGNGQTGHADVFYGNHDTLTLQGNSNLNVTGSNNAITVGDNSNISVSGGNNTVILGSGDNLWFSGATNSEVVIGAAGGETIESFLPSANDVIDLINGVGGYSSTAAIVSALASDGAGGSILSLGAARSTS